MMDTWQIRYESTGLTAKVDSPGRVLEGLRLGEWDVADEVRGPQDSDWKAIEDHPAFADFVGEMAPPAVEPPDETRLDMNPLIDVALVLLIFFILTTTVSSLRRSIELPAEPDDTKGQKTNTVRSEDLRDIAFPVVLWMEGDTPRVKIDDTVVAPADMERTMIAQVRNSGKQRIILSVEQTVPWGIEASVHDAAKAAKIEEIYWKKYVPAK